MPWMKGGIVLSVEILVGSARSCKVPLREVFLALHKGFAPPYLRRNHPDVYWEMTKPTTMQLYSSSIGITPRISPANITMSTWQVGHWIFWIMLGVPVSVSNLNLCAFGHSSVLEVNWRSFVMRWPPFQR